MIKLSQITSSSKLFDSKSNDLCFGGKKGWKKSLFDMNIKDIKYIYDTKL